MCLTHMDAQSSFHYSLLFSSFGEKKKTVIIYTTQRLMEIPRSPTLTLYYTVRQEMSTLMTEKTF